MFRRFLNLIFSFLDDYNITPIIRLSCGMSAGILACFITQPFDVLKTTAQLYPKDYTSVVKTVQKLYRNVGTGVFFKGFFLRASRRTLTAALNWTFFDEVKAKVFRNLMILFFQLIKKTTS